MPSQKFVYVSSPVTSSLGGGERFLDWFTDSFPDREHIFIGSSLAIHELFLKKGYRSFLSSTGFEPVTPFNLCLMVFSYLMGALHFIRYRHIFVSADIIISPTSYSEVFFLIPWIRAFNKKILHMVHSNKIPNVFIRTPLGKLLRHEWEKDNVVFVSDAQRQEWRNAGLAPDHAVTISNGVPIHSNKQTFFQKSSPDELRLGFLSRLHWEKGLDILLTALTKIKDQSRRIRLSIAGQGPEEKKWRELAQSIWLPPNISIEWCGFIKDTAAFYKEIDVLIFPSRRESSGLVLLEAWEAGLPVLTSDIPPFLEAKRKAPEAEQKLVFKQDDPDDLARHIDFFLEHRAIFCDSAHKLALHETIVRHFSLDGMMVNYRTMIESILNKA